MKKRLSLLINGKVQGVFFRASVSRAARKLGLVGFVQNLDDGRVRIVAEGSEKKLDKLVIWAKEGPSYAKVRDIKAKYSDPIEEFKSFEVRH